MAYLSDTTSARSGGIAHFFADAAKGLTNLFSHGARHRSYARAESQLRAMSDHELDDIGIARYEIRDRVWSNFGQI